MRHKVKLCLSVAHLALAILIGAALYFAASGPEYADEWAADAGIDPPGNEYRPCE